MSKKDAKIRVIRSGDKLRTGEKIDRLSISLEYDCNPDNRYPVLLFVPDTSSHEHWHIKLGKKSATALRDYLSEWLKKSPV